MQNGPEPRPVAAMLWPDEKNFALFRSICMDEIAPNHAAFTRDIRAKLARRGISENDVWKLAFDPRELAQWCRANGCKVDGEGRAQFAAHLAETHNRSAKG